MEVLKIVGGVGLAVAGFATGNIGLGLMGAGMAIGGVAQIVRGKPEDPMGLADRQLGSTFNNTNRPGAPLPVVYGTAKLGIILEDVRVDAGSTDNEDLYSVAALCHGGRDGRGINAIQSIWFNDQLAVNDAGTIQSPYAAANLAFAKALGTDTEDWSSASVGGTDLDTVFTEWASTDQGRRIAGIVFNMTYDADAYPNGFPTITAKVLGNHVEDPRDEVSGVNITYAAAGKTITRASGDFTDEGWTVGDRVQSVGSSNNDGVDTITVVNASALTVSESLTNEGPAANITLKRWANPDDGGGDNWALCVRDYLLGYYGAGLTTTDLNEDSFKDFANYSDVNPGTGKTTVTFTCNGWVDTGRSVKQNLDELLSAGRGSLIYEGGKFRLFTTNPNEDVHSLTCDKDIIVGNWRFRNEGAAKKFNVARATFIDPDKNYKPVEIQWPTPGAANTALTNDNNVENRTSFDLPFTNNHYIAENIANVLLEESRQGISAQVTCTEAALQYHIGSLVNVTHDTPGWTAKPFWVMGMELLQSRHVRVTLVEYDVAAYSLGAQTEKTAEPNTNLPDPFTVAAPTNLALDATLIQTQGGWPRPVIRTTWTDAADTFVKYYEIEAKKSADSDYQFSGRVVQGVGTFDVAGLDLTPGAANWDVRIRTENTLGVQSTWVSDTVSNDLAAELIAWLGVTANLGITPDPDDTLALFIFEEGTGTTVRDVIGNADATISTTGAGWVNGPARGGYDCNNAAVIEAAHATAHDIGATTAFTIDVVFRWDGTAGHDQELVFQDHDYLLGMTTAGVVQYLVRDHWATNTTAIDLADRGLEGEWVHLKWVYDGASGSTFYINGVSADTDTGSGAAETDPIGNTLYIGNDSGEAVDFNGAIAFARVALGTQNDFPFLADVLGGQPTIKRSLRIPHTNWLGAPGYDIKQAYLQMADTTVIGRARDAPVLAPKNITITKLRMRSWASTAASDVTVALNRIGSESTVATLQIVSIGTKDGTWQTDDSTVGSVIGDYSYGLRASLTVPSTASTVGSAKLMWVELDYTVPNREAGY